MGADLPDEPTRIEHLELVAAPRLYDWIDVRPYLRAGAPYPVQTKRGCRFACSYCVYKRIEGDLYRLRNPEAVADEIAAAKRDAGLWQFEFTDSVFNHPRDHAERVCGEIAARRLNVSLNSTGINPQHFTPELLRLMEAAGFEEYSFAPDSASPAVLKDLGKGYLNADVLERAAAAARASRLPVMWWFSLGLPGESAMSVDDTLRFIKNHVRKSDLALCVVGIRIYPGTRLAEIAAQEGQLVPHQDFLQPWYYEPREISLQGIYAQLQRAKFGIPHLLLTTEIRNWSWMLPPFIQIKRILRHHYPLWPALPRLNRIRCSVANLFRR